VTDLPVETSKFKRARGKDKYVGNCERVSGEGKDVTR